MALGTHGYGIRRVLAVLSRVLSRLPRGLKAVAVIFASVLPDLVDKPLAWEYGVFEVGYAIGHSIFFAVPLSIAVGALARSYGRFRAGIAFAIGYLLHLPADVVDGYVRDGHLRFWILLWPFGRDEAHRHAHDHTGFVDQFFGLVSTHQQELFSGAPSTYITLQVGLAKFAAFLWLYDGAPVLLELLLGFDRLAGKTVDRTIRFRD